MHLCMVCHIEILHLLNFFLCGSKAIYYLKANPIKRKQQLPDCTDCNKHQVYQQLPNILLKKSVLWI